MPKRWTVRKKIQGIFYDIYYYESTFYGGSKMITSRLEKVNEEIIQTTNESSKNKGEK